MWDLIVSVPDHCLSFSLMAVFWLNQGISQVHVRTLGITSVELSRLRFNKI